MTAIRIIDRMALDASAKFRKTSDGYLTAVPRVARTGIQLYSGSEVGMPEMHTVRVYRPPDQVFERASMATYGHKPITNDHPRTPITADNWKTYSVGAADGEVVRDGDFIRVPMLIMDGKAVTDIEQGKSELSVGYSAELKWESGVTPDTQEQYDAIQTAIRVNHIAIVDAARGGSKLRIGDGTGSASADDDSADPAANKGDEDMSEPTKQVSTILVDSIPLTMDAQSATIVSKTLKEFGDKLNASTAQVTQLTTDSAKAKAEHEAAIAKLVTDHKTALDKANAEIETLKKQVADAALTPEKLEALVQERGAMLGKAKAVLGDKLVTDKKSDAEIRRQVVDAKLGDTAKGWTDDQIKVSFDTLVAGVKIDPAPGVMDTARAFQGGHQPGPGNWNQDAKNKAQAEADKKLSERWKNPGGKAA